MSRVGHARIQIVLDSRSLSYDAQLTESRTPNGPRLAQVPFGVNALHGIVAMGRYFGAA
jgi:hypothetical protein